MGRSVWFEAIKVADLAKVPKHVKDAIEGYWEKTEIFGILVHVNLFAETIRYGFMDNMDEADAEKFYDWQSKYGDKFIFHYSG